MSRKNLYQLLDEMNFDVRKEHQTLLDLFMKEKVFDGSSHKTLLQYVSLYFRSLPFRGSYINIEDLMKSLRIIDSVPTLDRLFLLCEFLIAVLPNKYLHGKYIIEHVDVIFSNIDYILEKTNHMFLELEDSKYIIVEKNKAATQAAELIEETPVSIEVLEYNHYALKGNLTRKRQILNDIANYVEPILKSRKFQETPYNQIAKNVGFLLNCFHVRHNNKEGIKAQEYIVGLSDSDLEEWYDKIYNSMLTVIIVDEQISIDAELNDLKQKYHWKT